MLKSITVENFRAIKQRTRIQMRELTILVGPNSAGKSIIWEALEYLRYAMTGNKKKLFDLATSAENRTNGEASDDLIAKTGGEIVCGASFQFDEISKETRLTKEYDDGDVLNINGQYPFLPLLKSLDGSQLEIIFTSFGRGVQLVQDGITAISIDSSLYAWDGKDSIDKLKNLKGDSENFFWGRLTINPESPFGKAFQEAAELFFFSCPETRLGNILFKEADKNGSFYGISSDDRQRLNLPHCHFDPVMWSEYVDAIDYVCIQEDLSDAAIQKIEKRIRKDYKIKWPLRAYAEYCEAVSRLIEAILRVIYRRMVYCLDMPHVQEARVQLGNGVFDCPNEETRSEATWGYATGLVRNGGNGFARPLRKYLASLEFLGRYEVACEITERKIVARSYRNIARRHAENSGAAHFFLIDRDGRYLNFNEVGSGVSFVFPIFAAIGAYEPNPTHSSRGDYTIFIQQPELHLHPAAQCELADLFVWFVRRRGSLIIETHSEHLILRLLKRVREEFSSRKKASDKLLCERILINSFQNQDGQTTVKTIRVARNGEFLDEWPGGFFEEREAELFDE